MYIERNNKKIFHPGEILKDFLNARDIKQNAFAIQCNITEKHLSNILNAKVGLSSDFAVKLGLALNENPETWINMQSIYDIAKSELEQDKELAKNIDNLHLFPIKDMQQNGLISYTKNKNELIKEIYKFLGIANYGNILDVTKKLLPIIYRKFKKDEIDQKTQIADYVLYRWGTILAAENINIQKYNKSKFIKAIHVIREKQCLKQDGLIEFATNICNEVGVILICTPKISNAMASGYSSRFGENPLIHLTDRGKHLSSFWFSFYHEACHILNNHQFAFNATEEECANLFAENILFPKDLYNEFCNIGNFTKREIINFAEKINLPEEFVITKLQRDKKISYCIKN